MSVEYTIRVKDWAGSWVRLVYSYVPGVKGSRAGPREDWTPDEDASVDILKATYLDGSPAYRDDELDERWINECFQDQIERDALQFMLHQEDSMYVY